MSGSAHLTELARSCPQSPCPFVVMVLLLWSYWLLALHFGDLSHHWIIGWLGLEATVEDHLVHPCCYGQGHLSLDQVVQSPIQPDLELFQWWDIHNFSEQPVPASYRSHQKKFLANILPISTLWQFKTVAPCPVNTGSGKKSFSVFLINSIYILKGHNKVACSFPTTSTLSAFPHMRVLPALWSFSWPSSGPAPTGSYLSWAGDSVAGCRTPGGVSPPSPCWPRCF